MPFKDREVQLEAQRNAYQNNKAYYREQLQKRRQKNKDYLADLKKTLSCTKCGFSHPAALDFHHRDSEDKDMNVSNSVFNKGLENLKKEIEKCDVLCANCHRILHYDLNN